MNLNKKNQVYIPEKEWNTRITEKTRKNIALFPNFRIMN